MKAKSVAVSMSAVSLTEKQTQFNALIGHCSHSHERLILFFSFLVARSTCRKWNSALIVKCPVKSGGANSRSGPKTCYSISINFKSKPFSSVLNCVISSVTPFAIREVAVRCNRFALQASNIKYQSVHMRVESSIASIKVERMVPFWSNESR